MSELPHAVRIREVGPRDGFQNEPEMIPTDVKVALIDALGRTGLQRLELTSFVRADVIPQLADAAEVLERIDLPDDGQPLGPDPQRARARQRAGAAGPVRRDQRVHVGVGVPQPRQRQPRRRRSRWPASSGS